MLVAMNQDSNNMRLPVHVAELMQAEVLATLPEELLTEAAARMRDHQVGSLMVVEGEDLVGILSERDILRAVAEGLSPALTEVRQCMTRDPITARPGMPADEAALIMIERDVRHLPVVEGSRLVGMISAKDLLPMSAWPLLQEIAERS
jgi:CBS domain-containing protein